MPWHISKCQTLLRGTEGPAPAHPQAHISNRMGQSHHAISIPSFNCCRRQGKSTPGSQICLNEARRGIKMRPQTASGTGRAWQTHPYGCRITKSNLNPKCSQAQGNARSYGHGAGLKAAKQTAAVEVSPLREAG